MSLKRATQNWNMKYVDVVRSPGSALRVFTSSERLANHMKINENGESENVKKTEMGDPKVGTNGGVVGKLVRKIEIGGPQAGKLMKKVETGDMKVGELTTKIQMNDRKVGKVWRSARFGWSRGIHEI